MPTLPEIDRNHHQLTYNLYETERILRNQPFWDMEDLTGNVDEAVLDTAAESLRDVRAGLQELRPLVDTADDAGRASAAAFRTELNRMIDAQLEMAERLEALVERVRERGRGSWMPEEALENAAREFGDTLTRMDEIRPRFDAALRAFRMDARR